ncbi:L-type lectin-domain containing receptor kinase S.1 [Aristolochia californica]|uniref:L-type lectin-domain containing receptor kinase S.1 n=1 Tax=Aristolochia californica TaxID=171875 RepID=UPI0035D920D5
MGIRLESSKMLAFKGYLMIFISHLLLASVCAVDFLFNSFNSSEGLLLLRDARIDSPVVRLTVDENKQSIGRLFFPTPLRMKRRSDGTNATRLSSFSTSFIFSILPENPSLPGFGIAFVLSNSTDPPRAISGQYLGVFSNATVPFVAPLLAIEFDTGRNTEFNDPDDNHVGVDLNNIESAVINTSGYWDSSNQFVPIQMRSGMNVRAWIDFIGPNFRINVTMAPANMPRPSRPLVSYTSPDIADYISDEMFVGFSASKVSSSSGVTWVERQRILAWSLNDEGRPASELSTSNLPDFMPKPPSSSSLAAGAIAGITCGSFVFVGLCLLGLYWFCYRRRPREEKDEVEEWELEYWPHRFSYEQLSEATNGFSKERLLGYGGFGKVYKGVLASSNNAEIAVKCISHDSKQGMREFMAEISSMGRLQHKNLVQMRGWCRKRNELMLVYDYMPNGSLNKRIFDKPEEPLSWERRRLVLTDVAEGLLYLHHGWDQMVLHRDIKSSNILLDSEMRGRLGDFGLAKLYQHGQAPSSTRVVGTLGYMAPELAKVLAPTAASDVYSFGVVILEVATGRRPIDTMSDDDPPLIDRVRELYAEGTILEAADERIAGEYPVEEMERDLKLGLACCHPDPDRRPTMKEVVAILVGEEAAGGARRLLSGLKCGDEVQVDPQ